MLIARGFWTHEQRAACGIQIIDPVAPYYQELAMATTC